MANKNIPELLKKNNPFVSSASPLPWDNNNPDLLQLSREASEDIEQLMRHKRREPSTPLAGLVLGEAGSGKTHMLTRILRRLRANSRPAVFVAVKTFRDPESVTRHLLAEIFISLKRQHSAGRTQFDMIMGEFLDAYRERRLNDDFSPSEIEKLDFRKYIAKDIPGLERIFLKCILTYISLNDPSDKNDILDWLCDGLDDEDSFRLGLPSRDLNSLSDARRELEAEKVLTALGLILSYAKVPMIVCFDQLDAMKSRELISAWGNVISLLMNDLSGILPLCFIRSEIWNDLFVPVLDDAIVQRLRNNTIVMKTCSLEQAKLLLKAKIDATFKEDSEEIFQWLINKIGKNLHAGYSPRVVIEIANHALTELTEVAPGPSVQPDPVTPVTPEAQNGNDDEKIIAQIKDAYDEEYKKVQTEPDAWPPNPDQLALALEVWLESQGDVEFSKSNQKNVWRLIGKYHEKNFACMIVAGRVHSTAWAGLNRGIDFLTIYPQSFCCYITEKKTHKSTWKKVSEVLRDFEKLGGHVLMLDSSDRIKWYALTALINRIDNGDVNLYLPSGNRTATREDIKDYVKKLKLIDFNFDAAPKTESNEIKNNEDVKENSVPPDNASLPNILVECTKSSAMGMLGIRKAVNLLSQRGINMTADEILSFVKTLNTLKIYQSDVNSEPIITLARKG